MEDDLGYFDDETCRLEPIDNPFGPKAWHPAFAQHFHRSTLRVDVPRRDRWENPCQVTALILHAQLDKIRGTALKASRRGDGSPPPPLASVEALAPLVQGSTDASTAIRPVMLGVGSRQGPRTEARRTERKSPSASIDSHRGRTPTHIDGNACVGLVTRGRTFRVGAHGARAIHQRPRPPLAFLKRAGLQPRHYLLDAGCGSFRIGWRLINYLEPENYAAFDGSRYLLEEGAQQILSKHCDIARQRPVIKHLFVSDRVIPLRSEFERQFDVILVHAIFDHLPPQRIKVFLESLVSVMHEGTRVFATFFVNPYGESHNRRIKRQRRGSRGGFIWTHADREYWHHTPAFFERLCAEIGTLRFVTYHDYAYPIDGLKMGEFRLTHKATTPVIA